jgi:hypothetical protein
MIDYFKMQKLLKKYSEITKGKNQISNKFKISTLKLYSIYFRVNHKQAGVRNIRTHFDI